MVAEATEREQQIRVDYGLVAQHHNYHTRTACHPHLTPLEALSESAKVAGG
jgi:hypothetical protein